MTALQARAGRPFGRGILAFGGLVLALVSMFCLAPAAGAEPKFPALTGRVVDAAGILSPGIEAQLDADLAELERTSGRQLVVATVPDLQGYTIEDYGYQLGRYWGVGDEERDDGVVFLIAPQDRQVRIEVGYGLEPILTDALCSLILQRQVLPAFRSGDVEGGVTAGAVAIINQLALPDAEARGVAARAQAAQEEQSDPWLTLLVLLAIFLVIMWFGRRSPAIILGGLGGLGGGGWSGGGGGGGFSGGGGSFGGGGASGRW